jgi:hypothetical protein
VCDSKKQISVNVERRLETMFSSTKDGFTLEPVRDSGHIVPTFQPKRSLVLLLAFSATCSHPKLNWDR